MNNNYSMSVSKCSNKCSKHLHVWDIWYLYLINFWIWKDVQLYKWNEGNGTEYFPYREKNIFGLWKIITTSFKLQMASSNTTYVWKLNTFSHTHDNIMYWWKNRHVNLFGDSVHTNGVEISLWCLVWQVTWALFWKRAKGFWNNFYYIF